MHFFLRKILGYERATSYVNKELLDSNDFSFSVSKPDAKSPIVKKTTISRPDTDTKKEITATESLQGTTILSHFRIPALSYLNFMKFHFI